MSGQEERVRRAVTDAKLREGRGGLLGGDSDRRARWWRLTLECGHVEERKVRYRPSGRPYRMRQRSIHAVLPAPKRVHCYACAERREGAS